MKHKILSKNSLILNINSKYAQIKAIKNNTIKQ